MTKVIRKRLSRRHIVRRTRRRIKMKEKIPKGFGIIHVQASFNNTIVTVTDQEGRVFAWASAGTRHFIGPRKGTPYAGEAAMKEALQISIRNGLNKAKVMIKGPGRGRDGALRGIIRMGIRLKVLQDVTPLPHNGCRPPKKRRL
uniref:Ribosomal protein S11 n=1 Tax=Scaevola taccada TaxID=16481 RepID=A0A411JY19_SCATA|nr:ribosomal protein S11 [Scaevola taccada]QBC69982.1 ribosomal protein S11 [Scaevola taccada]